MLKTLQLTLAAGLLGLLASTAQATIIVTEADGWTTGPQEFSLALPGDFEGFLVTFGVSEARDECCGGVTLSLSNFSDVFDDAVDTVLNTDAEQDTSAFTNAFGEPGTVGELITFSLTGNEGDIVSFTWDFFGDDEGYPDFAFVSGGAFYEVLAQTDANDIPVPGTALLFGLGLLALGRVTARRKA
jgi:hypothetical protein